MRTSPRRPIETVNLQAMVAGIVNRWPTVGAAFSVVGDGRTMVQTTGLADIESGTPVTSETVFRIASVSKTMTAIAVMQLWERGLVDLDGPANDYLRAYKLVPARATFRAATIRHLLTHTAGIPDVIRWADLLHPGWGRFEARPATQSVEPGRMLPSLAEYYRGGLRIVVDPGTVFAYSNHGYATLGQIVEDVTGQPLDRYLRDRIFEPLGMNRTDLARSASIRSWLATGYDLESDVARPVADREWITRGASSVYSTIGDMGCFVAALAGGGANAHGRVLQPPTLATMFEPHYQPDPRLPGMGLGFFRDDAGGHLVVEHDGRLPGFNAQLLVAPTDGVGVVGLTNGSRHALRWMPEQLGRLIRDLLAVGEDAVRADLPQHPEVWNELCGRYRLPGRVSDLRGRILMSGGVEVLVRDNQLTARLRSPIPRLNLEFPLHPDHPSDPYLFRLDLSQYGMPLVRAAFRHGPRGRTTEVHTDLAMLSLLRQPIAEGVAAAVERLSADDQTMLTASRSWPQDVCALVLLDPTSLIDDTGRFRIEGVREAIAGRLHLVPRFRQLLKIPRRGRGAPVWVDAPTFDLAAHVRTLALEAPADEASLLRATEHLRRQPLDPLRPLWEMWVLTGLADGRAALFVRIHHAVADGLAAISILSAFLDAGPEPASTTSAPWTQRRWPSGSELVADNLGRRWRAIGRALALLVRPMSAVRRIRESWPATRELIAETPATATSLNRLIGGERQIAIVRSRYDQARRAGRRSGATLNDVLLAVTTAGIRALLISRGEPVNDVTLRAYVPVTLRRWHHGPAVGTRVAQMVVPLPVGEPDPRRRLRLIARQTAERKRRPRTSLETLFRGPILQALILKAVIGQRVNITTASLPGPSRPRYLAGARLLEVVPILALMGNVPLGVGAVSYAGGWNIGVTADRDAFPDFDILVAGIREELAALTTEGPVT